MATTTTSKPQLSALQTPVSATYPSESLRSPMAGTPTYIKREELDMKTPITPPAAYLDFLKTLSPTLMSPMITGTKMSFGEPSATNQARSNSSNSIETISLDRSSSTPKPEPSSEKDTKDTSSEKTPQPAPRRPSLSVIALESASRNNSTSSISTVSTTTSTTSTESISSDASTSTVRPNMKIIIPPPAPSPHTFARPRSARTPHGRLQHPMSPFSPVARTPLSATARTPLSATASAYSAVFSPYTTSTTSPRDWELEKRNSDGNSTVRQVSVRQVVTRTVMYTRTPVVDPVPASKRRKTEHVPTIPSTKEES